jgi:hypothetical protein
MVNNKGHTFSSTDGHPDEPHLFESCGGVRNTRWAYLGLAFRTISRGGVLEYDFIVEGDFHNPHIE